MEWKSKIACPSCREQGRIEASMNRSEIENRDKYVLCQRVYLPYLWGSCYLYNNFCFQVQVIVCFIFVKKYNDSVQVQITVLKT